MTIRIGSSCVKSPSMCMGKVAEVRTYLDGYNNSNFINAVDYCIKNQIYLIVNLCTHDGKTGHYPTNSEWINFVGQKVNEVISKGATKLNTRFTISNEPMKFLSKEQYANLINLAYQVINGRFSVGAGSEEFNLSASKGNMYIYILEERENGRCGFDILDLHIQTSCTDEDDCIYWTNMAHDWSVDYNIPLDCTEANYVDVATQSGYNTLIMQLNNAERIGCQNFCMVFMNLDYSAFPFDVSKWNRLAFKVNGVTRSPYWNDYKNLMEIKAPQPNIPEERTQDGMILPSTKLNSTGYLTQWVEEVLIILGYDVVKVDGIFSSSDVVWLSKFQSDMKNKYPDLPIVIDGVCGRQGYFYLNDEIADSILRDKYWRKLNCYASPVK